MADATDWTLAEVSSEAAATTVESSWVAALLLLAQIALGIVNVWAGKHAGLILGHLALGTVLWSTVVYAGATLLPASERLRRREVTGAVPA